MSLVLAVEPDERQAETLRAIVREAGGELVIVPSAYAATVAMNRNVPDVLLLSSADETAADVYDILAAKGLLSDAVERPVHRFASSGDPKRFAALGRRFLGPEVAGALHVPFDEA